MSTHTVLVMVAHYWGKGETLAEAKAQVRKHGGTFTSGHVAYYFGDGIEVGSPSVDEMGQVRWRWTKAASALPYDDRPMPVMDDRTRRRRR